MNFVEGFVYHIYNQGNNRRKIFYKEENYYFFLKKVKTHILPYADVLAWCLMPNHFHFMIDVKCIQRPRREGVESQPQVVSQGLTDGDLDSQPLTGKTQTLNQSIGIMLGSYAKAINKQENFSGSLFRQETKAICINCPKGIERTWFKENGITHIKNMHPDFDYLKICFDYIHNNPVKARFVNRITDWEFSSAKDYFENRKGVIINRKLAYEMGLTTFKG